MKSFVPVRYLKALRAGLVVIGLLGAIAFTLFGAYGFRHPLWFWISVIVGLTVILSSWVIYKRKNLQGKAV